MTATVEGTNGHLKQIEIERRRRGLKLNRGKCEQISINGDARDKIKFTDGTVIKKLEEVKYLGCNMNNKADPEREIIKRKKECMKEREYCIPFDHIANYGYKFSKLIITPK